MMEMIRPIKSEEDLAWAMAQVEPFFADEPLPGSAESLRFDILSDLIEAYENRQFSLPDLLPITFLKTFMELTGRNQADLGALLGSRSRASEVLNLRRALTVDMIHKLHVGWGLPAENLIKPYQLAAA
jgi:HTH-type transcriptional regulator / antitoxin HigA